jgi:hypothetical protein
MLFCAAVGEEVVRNQCQIVDLVMVLESDVRIGRRELEKVHEIHIHCVLAGQEKAPLIRIHYGWVELEKERESHSHLFEEQVRSQYCRERS